MKLRQACMRRWDRFRMPYFAQRPVELRRYLGQGLGSASRKAVISKNRSAAITVTVHSIPVG